MKHSTLKATILVSVLSLFLAACSSTPPDTGTNTNSGAISNGNVSTGSVGGDGVSGGGIDARGGVDTVFYFEFDKANLTPEAISALRIHAQRLIANPVSVRLEGHADERGTREYNMALGERRGAAVKEFLMLQGVNGGALEVISYGEESPAAMAGDESSWAMNRRVEIK